MSAPLRWRVWISGGSSGIGEALARELALRECRIALFARRREKLEGLRESLLSAHPSLEVLVQPGDVQDALRVREAVTETETRFGGIDVLILNAGTGETFRPEQYDIDLVERIMGVNFFGGVYAVGAALPGMLSRGSGTIVGISSIAGVRGLPGSGPYCSSKAALTTFLESLRLELQPKGVRVLTVSPGFIKTPLTDRNQFPMPFLQPVEKAARRILRGIEKGRRDIHFPKRLTLPMRILRCLPVPLYDLIMSRFLSKELRKAPSEEA
jgi:short-subunit dehydrogenase